MKISGDFTVLLVFFAVSVLFCCLGFFWCFWPRRCFCCFVVAGLEDVSGREKKSVVLLVVFWPEEVLLDSVVVLLFRRKKIPVKKKIKNKKIK
jgi:hypothetical protein